MKSIVREREAASPGGAQGGFREGMHTLRNGMALALGNSSALVLQVLAGVLTARFLLPRELGLFNGIGLAVAYASLLQIGIFNGLNRELPFLWGAGKRNEARRLAEAALAFGSSLGIVVFMLFSAVAIWQLAAGNTLGGMAWFAWAFIGLFSVLGDHLYPVLYKSTGRFSHLARIGVLRSAANLGLVGLVVVFGFVGLCLKGVLSALVNIFLLFRNEPLKVSATWWTAGLQRLLRVGFPIFIVGQLWALWILGNNTLILKLVGARGFGLYSIVLVVGNLATAIPHGISQVVYPKMAMAWGRGNTEGELMKMALTPTILTLLILVPAIVVGWILLPSLIQWILPRYVEAIGAMRWGLLFGFTACLTPINSIFNVLRQQRLYAVAILIGITAHGGTLFVMAARLSTLSLERFVQALLVGQLMFVLASYSILSWLLFFRWRTDFKTTGAAQSHGRAGRND